MKKIIAIFMAFCLILSGCNTTNKKNQSAKPTETPAAESQKDDEINFSGLDDAELLDYLEDNVYTDLIDTLNSDNYFVENVKAVYISQEYIDETAYNSRSNIYFGYTLEELEKQFNGSKFVFTLGDDGKTTVKEFEEYDDTYEKTLQNVAVGTGAILVCVTVSVVTGGAGVPAVSAIFASAAKTGTAVALSSGVISGVSAGVVTGIETKDFDEALKTAALAGSEGYKWGAITGAAAGGISEATALKGATLNGLSMNEAAMIQKESKWPIDIIKQIKSVDEYNVYKNAALTVEKINGTNALVPKINLNYLDKTTNMTNLELIQKGKAPVDPLTGKKYQLHHIGQKSDGTLAVLTTEQHQGNASILNTIGKLSEIDRPKFNKIRKQFWESYAKLFE